MESQEIIKTKEENEMHTIFINNLIKICNRDKELIKLFNTGFPYEVSCKEVNLNFVLSEDEAIGIRDYFRMKVDRLEKLIKNE